MQCGSNEQKGLRGFFLKMPRERQTDEIREGTRGGWGHFKWDDVKNDKHRMNYLGNSVRAPVGRWQEGRDLTWYVKQAAPEAGVQITSEERRRQELEEVKRKEQEYMNAAL